MNETQTYEVHLAIYDLSQGMARSLSAQFLGQNHAIDIIPHTAIVAFGREYYFGGGGIESSDPNQFRTARGLHPIEIQNLGRTNVSQLQFESWCRQLTDNGLYSGTSYDLLHRNCNNFSHHAATEGLRLSRGTPEWVLSVPARFLSSPMGQMIRPMLEQMQITGPSGDGGSGFASASSARTNAAAAANPWANIPATAAESAAMQTPKQVQTPILDSYNRPLLSNDIKMVNMCINKIKNGQGASQLDVHYRDRLFHALDILPHILLTSGKWNATEDEDAKKAEIKNQVELLALILESPIATGPEKMFTLMIMRLLVLQTNMDSDTLRKTMRAMLMFINGDSLSTPLRSMAWCVLSNAVGSGRELGVDDDFIQALVDSAMMNMALEHAVEVRRSAAAVLYNLTLLLADKNKGDDASSGSSDLYVTILCGVMEAVLEEKDVLVATRRLLVIGKIIKDGKENDLNTTAALLLIDLGYMDALLAVRDGDIISREKGNQVVDLADEIVQVLSLVC